MQLELTHESIDDALAHVVQALGGPKKVGAAMRPELPVDQAAGWIRDCLNQARRERFSPNHVIWLLRQAREHGVHSPFAWLAAECGYQAVPIEPEDERARLMREFIASQRSLERLADRLDRVGALRSVA